MDKIFIITENERSYFVEPETNVIYFTFDSGIDEDKIYRWSRLGAVCGPGALVAGRSLDSLYALISSTGINIFLVFMLIFPCIAIYFKFKKYNEQYYIGKRLIPAMLDDWKKEELLNSFLKNCKIAVIFTGVSSFLAIGITILFIISSKIILYILSAMILMMLVVILPYFRLFPSRLKIIKEILKASSI